MKKNIQITETGFVKLLKRIIIEKKINEVSPETFLSAAKKSSIERLTPKRTNDLTNLFFNKFIGMELLNGKIEDVDIEYSGIDHNEEFVEITIRYPYGGYNPTRKIKYDIVNDEFHNIDGDIDRRDSVKLGKIAAVINPDTKYRETGKHFRIKGWR